jgi:Tfp pilus assembly protein PilO
VTWIRNRLQATDLRRTVLFSIVTLVLLIAYLCNRLVWPADSEVRALRSQSESRQAEFARLRANLTVSDIVERRFASLADRARQEGNDAATLSRFLQDLEAAARYPTLSIVNITPLPSANDGDCRVYRVKMAVAGKLPEVTMFIGDVTGGSSVVGIESFSLRGVQGVGMVEFSGVLRMVRVILREPVGLPVTSGKGGEP